MEEAGASNEGVRFYRQQGIAPRELVKDSHVTIIGTGAVGSFTALTLAKMGIGTLELYDSDKVEEHNLPIQFFPNDAMGKPKVEALKAELERLTEIKVIAHNEDFTDQAVQSGIVISAVDSIKARKKIWRSLKTVAQRAKIPYYIDTRMGAQVGKVYTVDMSDETARVRYGQTFPDPKNVLQEACTARGIIYTVVGMASDAAVVVKRILVDEVVQVSFEVTHDFPNSMCIHQR